MDQLQKALSTNAIFSASSGILLIAGNQYFARLFGTANNTVFWITGIVLVVFSASILYQVRRQNPLGVLSIILQDFLWVFASIILLIVQPFEISKTGHSIIAMVALLVLLMGINQAKALARTDEPSKKGDKQLRFERTVKATKEKVWKVIADVANYHKVAPNIDDVKIISGQGQGMVRSCSHGNDSWTETCTKWQDEEVYSFEVNTSAKDYPYPFQRLNGTWKIEEIDQTTTKIVMTFHFRYQRQFQNWLLHPLLKSKFSKTAEALLDNWQNQLERKFRSEHCINSLSAKSPEAAFSPGPLL